MSARTRQRPGLGSRDAAETTAAVDPKDTPTGTAVEAGLSQRGAECSAPDPFRLVSDEDPTGARSDEVNASLDELTAGLDRIAGEVEAIAREVLRLDRHLDRIRTVLDEEVAR